MPKTFDFPYTMRGDTCPTCGTAREEVDGRSLWVADGEPEHISLATERGER